MPPSPFESCESGINQVNKEMRNDKRSRSSLKVRHRINIDMQFWWSILGEAVTQVIYADIRKERSTTTTLLQVKTRKSPL